MMSQKKKDRDEEKIKKKKCNSINQHKLNFSFTLLSTQDIIDDEQRDFSFISTS